MFKTGDHSDELCINTLRLLSADAVQQANSGHPGLPLGAAAMAYVLWTRFLRFNPSNPKWPNRDRFVHSAGHGSALLYALLHCSGYDISIEDLKNFRQWDSKTPGHPEYCIDCGIEATTGPLGQGFGMGVGMALAERFLAAEFNRPGFPVIDHHTYAIVSDGDLMEGIASEAASFAGHSKLGKLIYLYDDNHISIEGGTDITFTEDVAVRFESYGWHVSKVADGNDVSAIQDAISKAKEETGRPSLIMIRTNIGYGSPKQDQAGAHGEPLGIEGLKATKQKLNWPEEPWFHVPDDAYGAFRKSVDAGAELDEKWTKLFSEYEKEYPEQAKRFRAQVIAGDLPEDWAGDVPVFDPKGGSVATRIASGKVLNGLAKRVPALIGGSADLAPSTKTIIDGSPDQSPLNPEGRNIRFGVREHAMGAIVNGMALHGGVIPYGATFLVFSDYMRPSLRVASLMDVPSIFVFTHDSIAVGEDGPTHQPIEHLLSFRAIPNFTTIRPSDANETAVAWKTALQRKKPTALILTRQNLPVQDRTKYASAENLTKGAYVLSDCHGTPDLLLIATGSEVHLALGAQEELAKKGINSRVISMPSWELFVEQPKQYRDSVLPPDIKKRLAVEAGSPLGWSMWVGDEGDVIGINRFGSSAPGSELLKRFGFTVENVVERAEALVNGNKQTDQVEAMLSMKFASLDQPALDGITKPA